MAYRQKPPTFMRSCLKQRQYWYKINGKDVSKEQYNKYKNEPGKMERGGKTTNDPDPSGRKAAIEKARSKNKRPTVLTEAQTKLLEERTSKKSPPFKATAGFSILMEGAGKKGTHKYTSGDRSYRGSYDVDFEKSAFAKPSEDDIIDKNGGGNGGDPKNITSSNVKWPPTIKTNNKKKRNYATTDCEIRWNKKGQQTNRFTNLTKKQQRKIRKGQVGGI